MKYYHPMAKTDEEDTTLNTLFTYYPCDSLKGAEKTIFMWANNNKFHIVKAWIDVYEHGVKTRTIDYYSENS